MKNLEEIIKALPTDLQREAEDFVEFLYERWVRSVRGKPTFEWAGALRDLRDQYTSVELQHAITRMRAGEV